jgi:hypothetical protein
MCLRIKVYHYHHGCTSYEKTKNKCGYVFQDAGGIFAHYAIEELLESALPVSTNYASHVLPEAGSRRSPQAVGELDDQVQSYSQSGRVKRR